MEIPKSYITGEDGSIKGVVIDFETFKWIEETLLDHELAKAMKEAESDGTVAADEIRNILKE